MRTLLPAGLRLLAVLLLGLVALGPGQRASAHAVLRATTPADGAVLATPPSEVSVSFSEPVIPVSIRVVGVAGDLVDPLTATSKDGVVTLPLPHDVPAGRYLLAWRVTSLDGHPVSGAVAFAIGDPGAGPAPTLAEVDDVWPAAVGRFLHYLTLLAAAGLALFLAVAPGDRPARAASALRILSAVAVLAAVLCIGLEGTALLGVPVGSLAHGASWDVGVHSSMGPAMAVTIAGLAILLVAGGVRWGLGRGLLAAGAVVAVAGLALTGHAGTAAPRWLTGPALAIHALAAAFWLGALVPLVLIVARRPADRAAAALSRFSLQATFVVGALVLCGGVLAIVQVRTVEGIATPYGWRLVAKLVLVLGMLGLAAANRWRLTPRLAAGEPEARRLLLGAIGVEAALAVAVVALTVSLGTTPPPRAMAEMARPDACSPEAGTRIALSGGGLSGGLTVLPACTGRNRFYLALEDQEGHPLAAKEAALRLTQTEAAIGPLVVPLAPTGPGRWQAASDAFAIAGAWRVDIVVLVDDFRRTTLTADLSVSPSPQEQP